MRRTATAIALLIVPLLALSGCAPTSPATPTKPKPSSTPLFASEDEALKAATDAYAAYERALDDALISGEVSTLARVASGKALSSATKSVAEFQNAGKKQVGYSKISSVTAADLGPLVRNNGKGRGAQIYACLDVSAVDVLDASGYSVVSAGTVREFPTLVDLAMDKSRNLVVTDESIWDGKNFCA